MDNKKSLSFWMTRVYRGVTGYSFLLVLMALLFMSAFSTCYIDKSERTYFLPDSPWLKLLFTGIVILFIILVKSGAERPGSLIGRINSDKVLFGKIKKCMLLAIWFVLSLWVVCTQVPANADQRFALLAAKGIAERDFSPGSPFTYVYIYNNQLGWTMVLYLVNMLFGQMNYLPWQLINAVLIVLIIRELSLLGALLGMSRAQQLAVILLSTAFAPLPLYASFIYGTVPGLCLSLAAIRMEILYFRENNLKNALGASLCICFAVMMKMNYLLFMVAMLIYAAIEISGSFKAKKLLFPVLVAVFYLVQAKLPIMILEEMTGQPVPEGCSTLSWVAMGLQDGERPGWYNAYNEITFEESGYNRTEQDRWIKSDIKARMAELLSDPDYARNFFVVKTASQWNEPTYQSVWISINHYQDAYKHGVMSVDNSWPEIILSPRGNHRVSIYMDYLSFAIYVGAMLFALLCKRDENYRSWLVLAMIFVGGFAFHLVWEVKGQYALPYIVLLLPYAVMGCSRAASCLAAMPATVKNGKIFFDRKSLVVNALVLFSAVLILWYVFHGTLGSLTGDTEAYFAYLARHS